MDGIYTEKIRLSDEIRALHRQCGLTTPEGVVNWLGLFNKSQQLVGVLGMSQGLLQGIAIDAAYQGMDLTAMLLEAAIRMGIEKGEKSLYVYTKIENVHIFENLGFRRVLDLAPHAFLLEWGARSLSQYVSKLEEFHMPGVNSGCVVVNCNPFTLGHQYLIEKAAQKCEHLFVLVVEADQSLFSFTDRFQMIKLGTAHLGNVTLIPGGPYLVSALTFPAYFTRQEDLALAQVVADVRLFGIYIAPALGIGKRFVGTEPFSAVTEHYNRGMAMLLPAMGIEVEIVDRICLDREPISASKVRRLLQHEDWDAISSFVPPSTLQYLKLHRSERNWEQPLGYIEDGVTLELLLRARDEKAQKQIQYISLNRRTLVSIGLNIPGPIKYKPAWLPLIEEAYKELSCALKALDATCDLVERVQEPTGAYFLVLTTLAADWVKTLAVAIEERHSYRRLLDLDVMDAGGKVVSREALNFEPRSCFVCEKSAKYCMRAKAHPSEILDKKMKDWLEVALSN